MRTEMVWLNGHVVRRTGASVSVSDRGLLYGDGLFETIRVYRRHAFLLGQHLARLRGSARTIGIPFTGSVQHWRQVFDRLLAANRLEDAAVRLTITRGTAAGLTPPRRPRPTVLIEARRVDPNLPGARARGVAVCLLPFDRGPAFLGRHKTLAYLPAVLGRREARRQRVADGLYVTAHGLVTEATTANLFVCHRDRIRTPRDDVLPGIARRLVLDLARRMGLRVEERPVSRTLLAAASEVFLTGSVAEVLPVRRIDARRIGTGSPGPITRALQQEYTARVNRAVAGR
jgi:branched-chain amino acid aminotransferase